MSLDGTFAGLATKSCLESNIYPQLESMYSSCWNSPPELDLCHACKVPFCKTCVDTTNCWVNLWEQSFMLRENGWLLQCKLMKRKKTWQHDKRFFIVWPLTYSWISCCDFPFAHLHVLAQGVNSWTLWNTEEFEGSPCHKKTLSKSLCSFYTEVYTNLTLTAAQLLHRIVIFQT